MTHLFHKRGGARVHEVFPGSEEESSLRMGVSYMYPLPGRKVEKGLIGKKVEGSNLEKEVVLRHMERLERGIPPSARR